MTAGSKPANHKPLRKSAARLNAVQALYQMDVAATPLADILAQFESHWIGQEIEGDEIASADVNLFRDIVGGVLREQLAIDPVLDAALVKGWPLKRIEAVLRAVLRAGAYGTYRTPGRSCTGGGGGICERRRRLPRPRGDRHGQCGARRVWRARGGRPNSPARRGR